MYASRMFRSSRPSSRKPASPLMSCLGPSDGIRRARRMELIRLPVGVCQSGTSRRRSACVASSAGSIKCVLGSMLPITSRQVHRPLRQRGGAAVTSSASRPGEDEPSPCRMSLLTDARRSPGRPFALGRVARCRARCQRRGLGGMVDHSPRPRQLVLDRLPVVLIRVDRHDLDHPPFRLGEPAQEAPNDLAAAVLGHLDYPLRSRSQATVASSWLRR
jgi:hypothetical protein